MGRIEGKVAIVLGAAGAGNMGQTIARRLAGEGAKLMVAGRHEEPLKALAAELNGGYALCDITKKADCEALVDATLARFGHVDIGINATGWGLVKSFVETTREELDQITGLQFIGPFQFMQALVRGMTNGGSIIQISSATATIMLDDHAAYMGTKAGTDHVVRCVANQFGEKGIRANSISPGLTESPMTERAFKMPALLETFRREYPLGRIGTQDDVAEAALWLSEDSCFVTGQNIQVNGGLTLRRNPRNTEMAEAMAKARAERERAKSAAQ
jgi:NAD(P)-dependent dehydrogenase (short-subunit alcohol dehydrogenase family)